MNQAAVNAPVEWDRYYQRYQSGEYRARVFRDLVLADISARGPAATVLDIGCGHGFDGDSPLQASLASAAARYIGIDPDSAVGHEAALTERHPCTLEEAPIPDGAVDVAVSAFVLEHIVTPQCFWRRLHAVLRDGGVFWGFTMDVRHPFAWASQATAAMGVKGLYLDVLRGSRGHSRYENYPTYYRANSPHAIRKHVGAFRDVQIMSWGKVGQLDYYLPRMARGIGRVFDRLLLALRWSGSVLVVRLQK